MIAHAASSLAINTSRLVPVPWRASLKSAVDAGMSMNTRDLEVNPSAACNGSGGTVVGAIARDYGIFCRNAREVSRLENYVFAVIVRSRSTRGSTCDFSTLLLEEVEWRER